LKKIILSSATLTLAALLIAPKFIGDNIHSQLDEVVIALNDHPIYGAEVISYQQGWFRSEGEIALSLNANDVLAAQQGAPLTQVENPTVIATFRVNHGPLYVGDAVGVGRAHFTVDIPGDAFREHLQWDTATSFYHNEGTIGLFGGLSYEDGLPSFSAEIEEEVAISFSGYQGTARSEGDAIRYEGSTSTLSMQLEEGSITLSNFAVNMTAYGDIMATINGDIFESDAQLAIDTLTVEGEESVVLNNMTISSTSTLSDDETLANVNLDYAVASLIADDFSANDLNIGIAANNLDTDFIKAYQKFNNETLSTSVVELPGKVEELVKNHLLQFLTASPEFNITSLSGRFPEGALDAHLNSKIVNVDALPAALDDTSFWLQHVAADSRIKADKAVAQWMVSSYVTSQLMATPQAQGLSPEDLNAVVAQQVPMVLQTFVQQGILVENGDSYEAELVLKEGNASVNGATVPIPL
jgi:uncharacterized protein YdgA (DUF945 family)